MRLPSHDRQNQTIPDAMHTIKDEVEGIFHLITDRDDSEKVRRSEAVNDRFDLTLSHLDPRSSTSRAVPFRISATQFEVPKSDLLTCKSRPTST